MNTAIYETSEKFNVERKLTEAVKEIEQLYQDTKAGAIDHKVARELNALLKTMISACQTIHTLTEVERMRYYYETTLALRNEIKRIAAESEKRGIKVTIPHNLLDVGEPDADNSH